VDVASAKHENVVNLIKATGEFLTLTVISVDYPPTHEHHHGLSLREPSTSNMTRREKTTEPSHGSLEHHHHHSHSHSHQRQRQLNRLQAPASSQGGRTPDFTLISQLPPGTEAHLGTHRWLGDTSSAAAATVIKTTATTDDQVSNRYSTRSADRQLTSAVHSVTLVVTSAAMTSPTTIVATANRQQVEVPFVPVLRATTDAAGVHRQSNTQRPPIAVIQLSTSSADDRVIYHDPTIDRRRLTTPADQVDMIAENRLSQPPANTTTELQLQSVRIHDDTTNSGGQRKLTTTGQLPETSDNRATQQPNNRATLPPPKTTTTTTATMTTTTTTMTTLNVTSAPPSQVLAETSVTLASHRADNQPPATTVAAVVRRSPDGEDWKKRKAMKLAKRRSAAKEQSNCTQA